MSSYLRCALAAGACLWATTALPTWAAVAIDTVKDINNAMGIQFGGPVNVFNGGAPWGVDDTGVYNNNAIAVYSVDGFSGGNGEGLSISISNGENGLTSSEGGANVDVNNDTAADPVFATIGNASGRLENGNALRFSMWMRSDPNSPFTLQPSVEPVLKFELWKEAKSGNADFTPNNLAPSFGDRIWDMDQNANQWPAEDQASWVDANNSGTIFYGQPVKVSLVTSEWRRAEVTIVINDDPAGNGSKWQIGGEAFPVTTIEEIRAAMFVGDYAGTDLTGGGAFWVDNLMLEVFKTEALMLATPNPNPSPLLDESAGNADFNGDTVIDGADVLPWQRGLGTTTGALRANGDADADGAVDADDLAVFVSQFGQNAPAGSASIGAIPEPTSAVLALGGALSALAAVRRRA